MYSPLQHRNRSASRRTTPTLINVSQIQNYTTKTNNKNSNRKQIHVILHDDGNFVFMFCMLAIPHRGKLRRNRSEQNFYERGKQWQFNLVAVDES